MKRVTQGNFTTFAEVKIAIFLEKNSNLLQTMLASLPCRQSRCGKSQRSAAKVAIRTGISVEIQVGIQVDFIFHRSMTWQRRKFFF
jgi:hypothetical protein